MSACRTSGSDLRAVTRLLLGRLLEHGAPDSAVVEEARPARRACSTLLAHGHVVGHVVDAAWAGQYTHIVRFCLAQPGAGQAWAAQNAERGPGAARHGFAL